MFSLFDVLIYKLTNFSDIIIGIPMSIRIEEGFENCFGLLTNSLAFRTNPTSEKSYIELLNELRIETLNLLAYGNYPFDELVNELNIKRVPGHNPIFDIMFSFENANNQVLKIKDLMITNYEHEINYVSFDINFETMEKENQIHIYFNYNSDLFKSTTIDRWISYFNYILQCILDNKNILLSDIKNDLPNNNKILNLKKSI